MKTTLFISKVIVSVTLLLAACGMASAANSNKGGERSFIYNDSLKEGKVVVREIYALNKASYSMLPVKMNKYKYDLNGELAEKVTYKWNPAKVKWVEESKMNISRHTDETVVEYGEWISSKKGFLPSQKYVYVTNNDTNLVSQYCYKMNKHTSQWELQQKAVVSKIEDIFAQRN